MDMPTQQEFTDAATLNGYSRPTRQQYEAFAKEAQASKIETKQELAMFLAQILWESGGLRYKEELRPRVYDNSVGVPGKNYHGRGYIQLTHSYNYKAASNALKERFGVSILDHPELVSQDEELAWATAFWFWDTQVRTDRNVRMFHFGASTKRINGGECRGNANGESRARNRFKIYKNVLSAFHIHVAPIECGCYN